MTFLVFNLMNFLCGTRKWMNFVVCVQLLVELSFFGLLPMFGSPLSLDVKAFIRRGCIAICVGVALWLMAVYKNLERENNILLKSLERYTKVSRDSQYPKVLLLHSTWACCPGSSLFSNKLRFYRSVCLFQHALPYSSISYSNPSMSCRLYPGMCSNSHCGLYMQEAEGRCMDILDRHRNQVAHDVEHTFAQIFAKLRAPSLHDNHEQNLFPQKNPVLSNRMDSGGSGVENTEPKVSTGNPRRRSTVAPMSHMRTRSRALAEQGTFWVLHKPIQHI